MEQGRDQLVTAVVALREENARLAFDHQKIRESDAYQRPLVYLRCTIEGLYRTLHICEVAATRWPEYQERYLFPHHKDDIGEAAIAALLAIENGALNPARRELRYMLEVAVNTAFVDEKGSKLDLDGRINFFRSNKVVKQNVDHVRGLPLRMLGDRREEFIEATLDSWVHASNYVHLTKRRIDEKVRLRSQGVRLGMETPEMLSTVVREVHDACSIVAVLAFETLGPIFTGDILIAGVLDQGEIWPFHENRFIAAVDAHFDYKKERQGQLAEHVARRNARIT
ncbi:hypothetical protein [Pseudomonas syringae]|uniref:hypothetical protein n=1 Tax=Pseudomonas syringae TaxID=317 RepID=UPI001F2842BE|nr:hypothetical protein [Pseudomonas syringae]MCF5725645.1 hypothetical protein [Pseudomonas syringae]